MKKLLLAFLICLMPSLVFGALATRDDFNRSNTTTLFDSTHWWIERQLLGEGAITGNRFEWTVNAATMSNDSIILWLGDICYADAGCQIYATIGLDDGAPATSPQATGIVIMAEDGWSAFKNLEGFYLEKRINGVVRLQNTGGLVTSWSSTTRPKNDTGEDVSITIYKSGSDTMMDFCWGTVGNPCATLSVTGYNLTANGVTFKYGYTGFIQRDNTGSANIWWFDNFQLDTGERIVYKPWLSGLTSSGATVHAKGTSSLNAISVQYGTSSNLSSYSETTPSAPLANDGLIEVMPITGLSANTKYYYRVKVGTWTDSNIYSFKTLPTSGTVASYRFALIGCYNGNNSLSFNSMLSHEPLFAIATGDNGYLDGSGDRLTYFSEEMKARNMNSSGVLLQTAMANIPFYAMWNDHDSGANDDWGARDYINYAPVLSAIVTNGSVTVTCASCDFTTNVPSGGHTSFKLDSSDNSYKVELYTATTLTLSSPFHEASYTGTAWSVKKNMWWANNYYPLYYNNPSPPGGYDSDANYFSFQVGRTVFWVTNPLQYAVDPAATEGISKVVLGANQQNWLFDTTAGNFKNSTALLKFLIIGEPIATNRSDTGNMWWGAYTHELAKFKSLLRSVVGSTVILTGDSHVQGFNSIDYIPYVLEVNSSRVSPVNTVYDFLYKTGWYDNTGVRGFAIIDVNDNGTNITAEIKFYDENNVLLRRVYWGASAFRGMVCDYNATTCPSGRTVVSR